MAGFDTQPVFEACIFGIVTLPFILGLLTVNLEWTEMLAIFAVLDPRLELGR